jgi:hypothetical protein
MDRYAVNFKSSGFTDLKTKFIDKVSGPDRFEQNALYIHMHACEYPIKGDVCYFSGKMVFTDPRCVRRVK